MRPSPPGDEPHDATHGDSLLHTLKNKHTGGFLPAGEQYIKEWSKLGFVVNFWTFLELILVDEFFRALTDVSGQRT